MSRFADFLSRHALFIALAIGAAGFPFFRRLTPALPPLIFLMLFVTFCKVNPPDLRPRVWHGLALAAQMLLAAGSCLLLRTLQPSVPALRNPAIAEGVMLCFLQPTATAAAVVAGRLGGSIQNLTMYTILCNLAVVVFAPLLFPYVHPVAEASFSAAAWVILKKTGVLLAGPFVLAWGLRLAYDGVQRRKGSERRFSLPLAWAKAPFYLWVATIVILTGDIVHTLLYVEYDLWTAVFICLGAAAACLLQFVLGRRIGFRFPASSHGQDYKDALINPASAPATPEGISRVTAGQAMGQKNTTLAIWMAQTYLCPLAALGPAAYMIVQNLFIAHQLRSAARGR